MSLGVHTVLPFDKTDFILQLLQEWTGFNNHFDLWGKQKKKKSVYSSPHEQIQKKEIKRKRRNKTIMIRNKITMLFDQSKILNMNRIHKYTCLYRMIFFIKWLLSLPTINLWLVAVIMQVLWEAYLMIYVYTELQHSKPASSEGFSSVHPPWNPS